MSLKRNPVPAPRWYSDDFADACTFDLFSYDRWGVTVEWEVLLEQAKKIDTIALLVDKYSYKSKLFESYIDILEANMYIFDDLFYFLVGTRIGNEPDPEQFYKKGPLGDIYSSLLFWNLDCHDAMLQIHKELITIQSHIVSFLKQPRLKSLSNRIAEEWSRGFYLTQHEDDYPEIMFPQDRAHDYAIEAYKGKALLKPLVDQMLNVLIMLDNAITVFGMSYDLPQNCFPNLLNQFRKSEKGLELIKAWRRDFDGTRDNLLDKMEKLPELSPWVHRYHHLQDDEEIIEKLFHDEEGCWLVDEKEYYSTKNWISILKVATLIQEFDERQNTINPFPTPKNRRIKTFREFVKDADCTEDIVAKLHRIIGNQKNTDALRVIAKAMWIELINRPTSTSIKNEFPTVTCSDTVISNVLNEPVPTHPRLIEEIREEFEQA